MSSDLKRKRSSSIGYLRDSHKEGSGHDASGYLVSENAIIRQDKKQKRQVLQIEIPVALNSGLLNHDSSSSAYGPDSLFSFDGDISEEGEIVDISLPAANRTAPPIPGLFFEPSLLLLQELADSVTSYCLDTYFKSSPGVNQVMLFTRFLSPPSSAAQISPTIIDNSDVMNSDLNADAGLPNILLELLETISTLLKPILPPPTYDLLFPVTPTSARQAIINLYHPGEGITPHIDLLGRYGDGIIGVSFNSSCVMRFDRADPAESQCDRDKSARWDLYLPERSIIVLSREARYDWTHGIDKRKGDYVSLLPTDQVTSRPDTNASDISSSSMRASDGTWIDRGTRLSITFRWLLPGADVVGNDVS